MRSRARERERTFSGHEGRHELPQQSYLSARLQCVASINKRQRVREIVVAETRYNRIGDGPKGRHAGRRHYEKTLARLDAGETDIRRTVLVLRKLIQEVVVVAEPEIVDCSNSKAVGIRRREILRARSLYETESRKARRPACGEPHAFQIDRIKRIAVRNVISRVDDVVSGKQMVDSTDRKIVSSGQRRRRKKVAETALNIWNRHILLQNRR